LTVESLRFGPQEEVGQLNPFFSWIFEDEICKVYVPDKE